MRNILLVLGVFSLLTVSACTHIKIVAFDKTQNTVTVQGGKWANDEDYQKAADEYCHGPATLLAMNQTTVGSYTTANAQATTVGIKRYNKTFSCAI